MNGVEPGLESGVEVRVVWKGLENGVTIRDERSGLKRAEERYLCQLVDLLVRSMIRKMKFLGNQRSPVCE